MAAGADINREDALGWTPQAIAIHCENRSLIRLLADHGARLSAGDLTDIIEQKERSFWDFVARQDSLFKEHRIDITTVDDDGATLVHQIIEKHCESLHASPGAAGERKGLELLRRVAGLGVDLIAKDAAERTALQLAEAWRKPVVLDEVKRLSRLSASSLRGQAERL